MTAPATELTDAELYDLSWKCRDAEGQRVNSLEYGRLVEATIRSRALAAAPTAHIAQVVKSICDVRTCERSLCMQANRCQAAVQAEAFVQTVPDKCDRIVWRNQYFSLPLAAAPTEPPEQFSLHDVVPPSAHEWLEGCTVDTGEGWREGWDSCRNRTRILVLGMESARKQGLLAAAPATLTPAEPVMWQWQHLIGNPAIIEPFWTEWAECSKRQYEYAIATPDHQGRELYAAPLVHSRVPLVESLPADDRAAFEAWLIQRQRTLGYGQYLSDQELVKREENGTYTAVTFEKAWEAWQARAALAEPLPVAGSVREGSGHSVASSSESLPLGSDASRTHE